MALILGFLTLPLPAPSAKSILQSRSASHISAAATKQMSIPDLKKLSHHCFPASRGKAPARIARIFDVLIQAFPTPETPKRSCGAPQHRGHSKYRPHRESLNIRHQLLVTGHWSLVIANGLFAISAIVVFCPVYWASSKLWERRDGSEKGWGITFVARWPVSVTDQLISARRFFY